MAFIKKIPEKLLIKNNKYNDKIEDINDKSDKKDSKIELKNIKIASILDKFSYECFKYECNFMPVSYDNWKIQLEMENPNFLLVKSAWSGNNNLWKNKIVNLHISHDKSLENLVHWCKYNNIPTVFWNKEDPGNFNMFIEAAKLFDYVFTTDINCIERYKDWMG
jgi:hypothetical protein